MEPSSAFSAAIASVLSSTPPVDGGVEAAFATVKDKALEGPRPPLLDAVLQRFVQTHILPMLHVVMARAEIERTVNIVGDKEYQYYDFEQPTGVEVLASRYYRNNGFPDMPISTFGKSGGFKFHCAELVWNSAVLAGFHVPMNKDPKVPKYYGFYNSANTLFDQCNGQVAELATPAPVDSFTNNVVFKDASGKPYGLPGPHVGDVLVARHAASAEGVRSPGHAALLAILGPDSPTFLQAGASVGTHDYPLNAKAIYNHDTRLVRPRTPDWDRIERWLAEGAKPDDFKIYFQAAYPTEAKEKSYRGLFTLAIARAEPLLPAGDSDAAKDARAQLNRLKPLLGLT
jgi:hypothetical protein